MPFNINEFKSTLNRYGGPARKNLFEVQLGVVDQNTGRSDVNFFCKSVTIPGINIAVQDYKPNGFGITQSVPTSVMPEKLNCVFILDSQHIMISLFHRWMQRVVNYDVSAGIFSQVDNQLPYEFGYKDEYAVTMTIRHYSTDYSGYYTYTFYDVFPTEISGVDLSWEDNDTYSIATVNFSYSSMKVDGTQIGTPTDRFARGTGLLDYINRIGAAAQVISQSNLPRSIQDAADRFIRIQNTANIINSLFR